MQDIFIIVLNWNNYNDTKNLIQDLLALSYECKKIVLVDNNSEDLSGEKLSQEFPSLHYIQTGYNSGFAGGNNIGIKYAIENDADYIWILNNDIRIKDNNILNKLYSTYLTIDSVAFLGVKIIDIDKKTVQFIKTKLSNSGFPEHLFAGKEDKNLEYSELEDTDYVQGASMFFSSDLIQTIGYMDEKYFLYFEETDWCLRASNKGLKNLTLTSSEIYHSSPDDKIHMYYYMFRNYILFTRNFSLKINWRTYSVRVLKDFLTRLYSKKTTSRKKAYAILKGTFHGVIGLRGKQ